VEKEIWKGLIQISQDAPIKEGILSILSRIPHSDIPKDVRNWFSTENLDQQVMDNDFFTFLQGRAMAITYETPKFTPPPTLVPTPPSILADTQASLDAFQKSAAWQQLGINPALFRQATFAPQTPPLTPTPLGQIINHTTSPSPNVAILPLLSMDSLQIRDEVVMEIDRDSKKQYPEDIALALEGECSQSPNVGIPEPNDNSNEIWEDMPPAEPTHPVPMELEEHLTPVASTSHKADDEDEDDSANSYMQARDEVAMEVDDDSRQQSPSKPSDDVRPSEPAYPVLTELENDFIPAASTSPPASPIRSIASDTVDKVQELSSDNINQQGGAAEALTRMLNIAMNTNASEWPETDSEDKEEAAHKSPKSKKKLTQLAPKLKNEVIDLTLEEVSCSILFGPAF
jgi:hypothetical protein